jgi:hypothetical protein
MISYSYGPGYKGVVCTLIMSQTEVKLGIFRGTSDYKDVPTKRPIPEEMFAETSGRAIARPCVFELSHPGC